MMMCFCIHHEIYFCLRFRRCCDAGSGEPSWRHEVRRTLRDGARSIVDSLLRHPDSCHYRHDRLHDLHVSLQAAAEATTLPVSDNNVTKNLCKADLQIDPTETASTANVKQSQEEDSDDCPDDNSSYVSLNSTLPSSLSTDAPPSIFSYSSYESDSPRILSPDKIDITKLSNCKVSLKKMAFYSWSFQNKDLLPLNPSKKEEEQIQDASCTSSDSDVSQMTDVDVLCVSDEALNGNPEDSLNENCADYALDLNELKSQIDGAGVASLMDFHLNIRKLFEDTHTVSSVEIRELYLQLLGEVFPWFDASNPGKFWSEWEPSSETDGKMQGVGRQASRDYLVKPSSTDHVYASKALKRKLPTTEFNMKKVFFDDKQCDNKPSDDTRKCVLCGVSGDGDHADDDDDCVTITGRLIPLRFSEWVHINCALWSNEVYEAEDGSLQNVFAAVTRSKTLQCTAAGCHTRGATLGCCHPDCSHNYHLQVWGQGAIFFEYFVLQQNVFSVRQRCRSRFQGGQDPVLHEARPALRLQGECGRVRAQQGRVGGQGGGGGAGPGQAHQEGGLQAPGLQPGVPPGGEPRQPSVRLPAAKCELLFLIATHGHQWICCRLSFLSTSLQQDPFGLY